MSFSSSLSKIAEGRLTPQPLESVPQFNWVFLVELIVCGVLTLFFLFYFNRLFSTLVSYGVRSYTWHYYRVHLDIHALQISLLAGRIFFKGVRYHGENETILVQTGHITWRYWLRSVGSAGLPQDGDGISRSDSKRQAGDSGLKEEPLKKTTNGEKRGNAEDRLQLPCRIAIVFHGLEWFVYNRSAAYDSILSGFGLSPENNGSNGTSSSDNNKKEAEIPAKKTRTSNTSEGTIPSPYTERESSQSKKNPSATYDIQEIPESFSHRQESSTSEAQSTARSVDKPPAPSILKFLPLSMVCHKGAMVMGNENAKSILTFVFDKAVGEVAAKSAGPLDIYKQVFEYDISHPVVQFKPNPDFKQSQLASAKGLDPTTDDVKHQRKKRNLHWRYQHHRRKIWHSVRDLIPYFQSSVESFHFGMQNNDEPGIYSRHDGWAGLTRYLDEEDQDEHEGWNAVEYGRFSTLIDCPSMHVAYYWDIAGTVLECDPDSPIDRIGCDINGADAPDWGMDLVIRGGMINYGPWADRERANLQTIFFPNSYQHSVVSSPLEPGQVRQSTKFKLKTKIEAATIVRIPTREPSKDWLWKGRADDVKGASQYKKKNRKDPPGFEGHKGGSHGPDIRPFGWLSIRIGGGSTIDYSMDMFASTTGYCNQLQLDLHGTKMTSSINHGLLWQCNQQIITCDLSNPLEWNSLHAWSINVENNGMELFLLRDHVFLLTDLITDWTSGPSQDFYTFVPFKYSLSLCFTDLRLFMNVNDSNIVNNPSDPDDNAFLTIEGKRLSTELTIPMINYRPNRNTVTFDINLLNASMSLSTPLWNTQRTFLRDQSVATLDNMAVHGSYVYNISTSPSLTDVLTVCVTGALPKLYIHGFLVKYLLNIKENYFGEYQHFKTLEEYQDLANNPNPSGGNSNSNHTPKNNDLDVILNIAASNAEVILPGSIYDSLECLSLQASSLDADARFTNYYMDLETSFSPLEISLRSTRPDNSKHTSSPQLFVDGLGIYGHRLFGLPPTEPTYVCNWDFEVGRIVGECSSPFLKCAKAALTSFGFSIDDEENSLPPLQPAGIHDIVFLRAKINTVRVWTLVDEAAFLISSGVIDVAFNDWCGPRFSEHLDVIIPDLVFAAVDRASAGRSPSHSHHPVNTYAYFHTSLKLKMLERKSDFKAHLARQQQYIRFHDQRSRRTPWLLHDKSELSVTKSTDKRINPTAMPIPSMPEPVRTYQGPRFDSLSELTPSTFSDYSDDTIAKGPSHAPEHVHPSTYGATSVNARASAGYSAKPAPTVPSSWKVPKFNFNRVEPDDRNVPSLPQYHQSERGKIHTADIEIDPTTESENVTQVLLHCVLDSGLSGFCSPEALYAMYSLLDDLQLSRPVDIIDDLQCTVMSNILKREKFPPNAIRVSTLSLQLPICRIRVINSSAGAKDQYDLDFHHTHALIREKVRLNDAQSVQPLELGSTTHVTTESVTIWARGENLDVAGQTGICHCKIDEVALWSVADQTIKSRIQIKGIDVISSNESVEGLGFLIGRTNQFISSIAFLFQQGSKASTNRLRSLVYSLTKAGSQIPEPQFLTRPSYVLRSAKEHLRLNDSWKILSRLRNIYESLSPEAEKLLRTDCINNTISCPSDAKEIVLSSFDKWRTWDLAHVKKSFVMKLIWAGIETPESNQNPKSVQLSISTQFIHFSLDPGPKENDLLIEDLSTCIKLNMDSHQGSYSAGQNIRSVVVQNYCSNASLKLKWELVELVEGISKLIPTLPLPIDSPSTSNNSTHEDPEVHFAFTTDHGSLVMDGINLRLILLGDALKGSIIYKPTPAKGADTFSVVLASDTSSVQFTSRSKPLMMWEFHHPNIHLSHTLRENGSEHDWKCAAACKKLLYEITEDPLGLIQVADRVVEDEIRYTLNLVEAIKPSREKQLSKEPSSSQDIHHFHVATFLDYYQIYVTILPSVAYFIAGDGARLSVTPLSSSKFQIDFDIKNNLHTLQSNKDGNERIISSMRMPPINGRILIDTSQNRTSLDVDTTVELVKVEAGAVRNILGAINGPEISHFVADFNHDARILKNHFDQAISGGSTAPPAQADSQNRDLLYRLRFTLAGIAISSSAPGLRSKDYSADMDLKFGIIQSHVENMSAKGHRHEHPEFEVYLSQVAFDIKRRDKQRLNSCGRLVLYARISGKSKPTEDGTVMRLFNLSSRGLEVELSAETASMLVDIAAHLQETLKTIDLSQEINQLRKLRLIKSPRKKRAKSRANETENQHSTISLSDAIYSVELANIQVSWLISSPASLIQEKEAEDLVFSIRKIELSTKKDNDARLRIENMQLQMIPTSQDKKKRSQNSAFLPEAVFNVSYSSINSKWRFVFQAAGKALDIRMTSDSIVPASLLQRSLASASERVREAKALWVASIPQVPTTKATTSGVKHLESLIVDADFAGAIVSLQGRQDCIQPRKSYINPKSNLGSGNSKYGQQDSISTATLRAPGVALKVRFEDYEGGAPTLDAEIKVDASTNTLYPTVVPLITQISSGIQDVVGGSDGDNDKHTVENPTKTSQEKTIGPNDPTTILGRCKLNIGLWIRKQEFTLSCQPIARVAATACFDDVHITVNTVQSQEQKRFFAMLVAFNRLQTSVKHVYSNESTASFDVDSVVVSMMNSKHVSSNSGISAILKISPTKLQMNAKQVQDFLLFREIWMPPEDPSKPSSPIPEPTPEAQPYVVQRYQQMAAAGSFPWNSTLAMDSLDIQLDVGQTVGKSEFTIKNLWVSSKKNSDWKQNLCIGFETIGIQSKGRLSGFVELSRFKARTSIEWPDEKISADQTPLIQAAIGFDRLQAQVSFEYQPFIVVDVNEFEFLMYNVRDPTKAENDRLVSSLKGDKLHLFCTALTASQGVALYQTIQRLVKEKRAAYALSLKEIERFIQRKSLLPEEEAPRETMEPGDKSDASDVKMPISLHTDVVVNFQAIKIGSFPNTFQDTQIFKLEALDAEARFSVAIDEGRIHSGLGLTLGQLRVALSNVARSDEHVTDELSVAEIVNRATNSRGGTILKVPQVVATMETWQSPTSNNIEYIFKSSFEGKVDVGWNYSRIAFIRGMWSTHSRALASRLGKPLPQAAVQITGGPKGDGDGEHKGQEKITAVVNVPQSRYTYTAIDPPVIETPQLRDMGEATPPLEWIGLHRDKLPNITHQIIIVTLMEIATDVEEAYSKILGSS